MTLSIAEYGILGAYARFRIRQEPECKVLGYDKNFTLLPQYEVRVCGRRYILDFFVPVVKIAVEVDGRQWHSTNKQRESDYDRERNLVSNSFTVLRFTANQALEKPTECLVQIYNLYCRLSVEVPIEKRLDKVA